jgi:hypothetical protein
MITVQKENICQMADFYNLQCQDIQSPKNSNENKKRKDPSMISTPYSHLGDRFRTRWHL